MRGALDPQCFEQLITDDPRKVEKVKMLKEAREQIRTALFVDIGKDLLGVCGSLGKSACVAWSLRKLASLQGQRSALVQMTPAR